MSAFAQSFGGGTFLSCFVKCRRSWVLRLRRRTFWASFSLGKHPSPGSGGGIISSLALLDLSCHPWPHWPGHVVPMVLHTQATRPPELWMAVLFCPPRCPLAPQSSCSRMYGLCLPGIMAWGPGLGALRFYARNLGHGCPLPGFQHIQGLCILPRALEVAAGGSGQRLPRQLFLACLSWLLTFLSASCSRLLVTLGVRSWVQEPHQILSPLSVPQCLWRPLCIFLCPGTILGWLLIPMSSYVVRGGKARAGVCMLLGDAALLGRHCGRWGPRESGSQGVWGAGVCVRPEGPAGHTCTPCCLCGF